MEYAPLNKDQSWHKKNLWHVEETYKSMIQISMTVMRFILVANGGAAVALLSFAGNLYVKGEIPPNFTNGMFCFIAGVVFGGLTAVFAYMTQLTLFREDMGRKEENKHHMWMYAAACCGLFGIVCFGVGACIVVWQFQ